MLTGGQVADCTAGEALLERLPHCDILHADKGYDANAIRQQVERRGTMPNIPPKANRKWKNCFSPFLYRNRNAIERMFCRLKDFRRVATRYDRNAVNFLAAVCIAGRRQLLVMSLDPRIIYEPSIAIAPSRCWTVFRSGLSPLDVAALPSSAHWRPSLMLRKLCNPA